MLLREPSLVSQVSSPIKFAEYLAAGLPVLLLEGIGDTEEIISKYGVGVIIRNNNFKDAIIDMKKLLNDQKIYEKCLNAAQKEFNIEDSFEEYKNIYKNLIDYEC
jgi:glycosyltransferase involved in cell wall biosynthesis